jgi:hypothetical protein
MTTQNNPVLSFNLVEGNLYEVSIRVPIDHSKNGSLVTNSNLGTSHSGKTHENEVERLLNYVTKTPDFKGKCVRFVPEDGTTTSVEYETSSEFKTRVEPTLKTEDLFFRRGMMVERVLWCLSSWVASGECEDRAGIHEKRREVYDSLEFITLKTFVRSVEMN